jgi:2'-5' RNA ligase
MSDFMADSMVDPVVRTDLTDLHEHWRWRPDWPPERECLWWYLTFEDAPELARLAHEVTSALTASAYLDVIPPDWLHLTLREVGYADSLSDDDVATFVATASRRLALFESLALEVGPVGMLDGAVALCVRPAHAVQRLRDQLPGHSTQPLAEDMPYPVAAPPHVSLAYVARDCRSADLRLAPGSATSRVGVRVSHVVLASVTRRDRHYQWTVRARLPFGAPDVPRPRREV